MTDSEDWPPIESGAMLIKPTTRRVHITGMAALNIPDLRNHGGDWHKHSTWFAPVQQSVRDDDYTIDEIYRVVNDRLGPFGIHDARKGLRSLGHPGGNDPDPIWAATHDRAVIEMAWHWLMTQKVWEHAADTPPIDPLELTRWLFSPFHWIRLYWWAWKLRWSLSGTQRQRWDGWRREWHPWATY